MRNSMLILAALFALFIVGCEQTTGPLDDGSPAESTIRNDANTPDLNPPVIGQSFVTYAGNGVVLTNTGWNTSVRKNSLECVVMLYSKNGDSTQVTYGTIANPRANEGENWFRYPFKTSYIVADSAILYAKLGERAILGPLSSEIEWGKTHRVGN